MNTCAKDGIVLSGMAFLLVTLGGCNPTVTLEAPDKPVRIDLNIKIDQEVRIKLEKDVDKLVKSKPDLF